MNNRLIKSLLVTVLILQVIIVSFQIYSYFNPAIWYKSEPIQQTV